MHNPFDYRGKVALLTGAATGMGLATATRSLKEAPPSLQIVFHFWSGRAPRNVWLAEYHRSGKGLAE